MIDLRNQGLLDSNFSQGCWIWHFYKNFVGILVAFLLEFLKNSDWLELLKNSD